MTDVIDETSTTPCDVSFEVDARSGTRRYALKDVPLGAWVEFRIQFSFWKRLLILLGWCPVVRYRVAGPRSSVSVGEVHR